MEAIYTLFSQYLKDFDVFYGFQKINIDEVKNTIAITLTNSEDTSNNVRYSYNNIEDKYYENIVTSVTDYIQIDYVTRDIENSVNNLNLIRSAFASTLAETIQENMQVKFSTCNQFMNSSEVEGVGYVARYTSRIKVFRHNIIKNEIEYYDKFTTKNIGGF